MEERLAIIADDFTGAADSGIKLAEGGRVCALATTVARLEAIAQWAQVIALDTESRSLPPPRAAEAVRFAIRGLRDAGFRGFFKKVDSTLRGNLGAEIEAALAAAGCPLAVFAPSAPRNGRTVVDGLCFVGGAPLAGIEYAHGPSEPPTSSVAELIARQTTLPIAVLTLAEVRRGERSLGRAIERASERGAAIVCADGEALEDLAIVARAGARLPGRISPLFVGSSGLAEAIAGSWPATASPGALSASPATEPPPLPEGPALYVVGSRSGLARRQAEELLRKGRVEEVLIDPEAGLTRPEEEGRRLEGEVAARRPEVSLLLLPAHRGTDRVHPERERALAALLGNTAKRAVERMRPGLVVATGGDTAAAVVGALGIGVLRIEREIFPGVVLSRASGRAPRPFALVTKAGGFGDEQTLFHIDRWWTTTR